MIKRYLFPLLAVLTLWVAREPAAAQGGAWVQQSARPTSNTLYDLTMPTATDAWAVGENGTILHSADGGATWSFQHSDLFWPINGIDFIDAQNGVAVGYRDLYTTDGGQTWRQAVRVGGEEDDNVYSPLLDVDLVDATTAWAVGSQGLVMKSTDGGASWVGVPLPEELDWYDFWKVQFVDSQRGWILSDYGLVLRTEDGGANWSIVEDEDVVNNGLTTFSFVSASEGWILGWNWQMGGNLLLHTTDGGVTWEPLPAPPGLPYNDIHFIDALNGVAVSPLEGIYRTTNGGQSWTQVHFGPEIDPEVDNSVGTEELNLLVVRMADAQNGVAVGPAGRIFSTSDGGASWVTRTSGSAYDTSKIVAVDANHAWAISGTSEILRTTNGGQTWERHYLFPLYSYASDIHFVDAQNGWVSGSSTFGSTTSMWKTADGGVTWTPVPAPLEFVTTVHTLDGQRIIAGSGDRTMYSVDGGANWTVSEPIEGGFVQDVQFTNQNTVWLTLDSGRLLKSLDGGASFEFQDLGMATPYFVQMQFLDELNGFILTRWSTVLVTNDGGDTWTSRDITVPLIDYAVWTALHVVDANTLWVVGFSGHVARSLDGGQTWEKIHMDSKVHMNAVWFLDGNRGWVGGGLYDYETGEYAGRIFFRELTEDAVAPTMSYSGLSGSKVRALSSVKGTAKDNAGGTQVNEVQIRLRRASDGQYWNGNAWSAIPTLLYVPVTTDERGIASWQTRTPLPSDWQLEDGEYIIEGKAYDNAGNATEVNRTIVVDRTTPAVTFTRPATVVRTLTVIAGNASDASGIKAVRVALRRRSDLQYWNGSSWQPDAYWLATTGTGSWRVSDPLPAGADLVDGDYILYAHATDQVGNGQTAKQTVRVDATAPAEVAFTTPTAGAALNALRAITGRATDNTGGSGIEKVAVRIRRDSDGRFWNGSAWNTTAALLPATDTRGWGIRQGLPAGADLPAGLYTLTAYAYDKAGNQASRAIQVRVDTTAPTSLTFTAPSANSVVTSLPAVTGTATDEAGGTGIARVAVRLWRKSDGRFWNGSAWVTEPPVLLQTSGTASWQVTSALPSGTNLPAGEYRLYGYAWDRSGNVLRAHIGFRVR
jgi:photosystem II stability/assembly factor-like uncharacterized protein